MESARCAELSRADTPVRDTLGGQAVLAQRLFIEKDGLPSPLLSRLRRLAAFQSPEFYKRQRLRLSTNQIPRVVVCAEDLPTE